MFNYAFEAFGNVQPLELKKSAVNPAFGDMPQAAPLDRDRDRARPEGSTATNLIDGPAPTRHWSINSAGSRRGSGRSAGRALSGAVARDGRAPRAFRSLRRGSRSESPGSIPTLVLRLNGFRAQPFGLPRNDDGEPSLASSWRKPGPITPNLDCCATPWRRSRSSPNAVVMGPGFRQDDGWLEPERVTASALAFRQLQLDAAVALVGVFGLRGVERLEFGEAGRDQTLRGHAERDQILHHRDRARGG
jgi:hypothetical protein